MVLSMNNAAHTHGAENMTYGHTETNALTDARQYSEKRDIDHAGTLDWSDHRLGKITRLRLLSDYGMDFWDVSYCHGVTKDGRPCDVELPFQQLPRGRGGVLNRAIIAHAKASGVYAKGLGIFDNAISTLV